MDTAPTPELALSILESLSEGVCAVDRNWHIICLNPAATQMTGVRTASSRKLLFGDLFRCEACECRLLLADVMERGTPIRDVSTRIQDAEGHPLPVSLNAVPFRDATGGIAGIVATFRDNRALESLRRELRAEFTVSDIVSKNDRIRRILSILPDVAESDSTVLILGPSGTGKELIARAIHNQSTRAREPFVAVNCAALPDTLLESELFGHRQGAFTDARRDREGRFGQAEGGTLFLDEVGDLSPAMQVKLLRVLQERQYEPLGANGPVAADVRILAATNRPLRALVDSGSFRADLYYRLNVIEISLPALRERLEDVPLLAEHFLEVLNAEKGRGTKRLSPGAMARLMRHDYPGNIRELRNILERAYVLCRDDIIREECLPVELLAAAATSARTDPGIELPQLDIQPLRRNLPPDEEARTIAHVLEICRGHRGEAARRLGIHPATLWRKMQKYGLA